MRWYHEELNILYPPEHPLPTDIETGEPLSEGWKPVPDDFEKPPDPPPPFQPLYDEFLLRVLTSPLYAISKNSLDATVQREKAEVQAIVNGRILTHPLTIAENGLLHKNLQELVSALGSEVSTEDVTHFNTILKEYLGVSWEV